MCDIPIEVVGAEKIVRIVTVSHVNPSRTKLKPRAFRSRPGYDEVSVIRHTHRDAHFCKAKALELAKIANEPVLETPVPIADVAALKTAPIEAVNPAGEPVPVAAVVQAPPVQIAKLETLPRTASNLPLLFCVGLLSLGAAGLLPKHSV